MPCFSHDIQESSNAKRSIQIAGSRHRVGYRAGLSRIIAEITQGFGSNFHTGEICFGFLDLCHNCERLEAGDAEKYKWKIEVKCPASYMAFKKAVMQKDQFRSRVRDTEWATGQV